MTVPAKTFPASPALCDHLGEGPGVIVDLYVVPGGYVFSYGSCFMGHGFYGLSDEAPFPTLEAAEAAATALSDDVELGEFCGDLGDLEGDGEPAASGSY